MSISMIKIENFRSIKKCVIDFKRINVLIGENGSGKSNIISAICYFYDNLIGKDIESRNFDINNKLSNCIKISITYDLSSIQKISQNHLNAQDSDNIDFFEKIVDFCNEKRERIVTLVKIKGKSVIWEGADFQERQLIYNLFPLYTVDSRKLNLIDWGNLWEYIGDLTKVKRETNNEIKKQISDVINNPKYKIDSLYNYIKDSLEISNIKIKKYTPKQEAANLSQIIFAGNKFELNDRNLENNSNGVNALSYTKILIKILNMIAEKKMKEPIILMDEPELSLHHIFIDELSDAILGSYKDISFVISTHSPRFVKDIMKYGDNENERIANIYHTKRKELYTSVVKMNMFSDMENSSRVRINDEYANTYFSKLILAVEGETEVELFSNYYLRELFPVLKNVDVVNQAMSNDTIRKIISPKYRNHAVPIITIFDMDKILSVDVQNNIFSMKSGFCNEFFCDKYFYGKKRYNFYFNKKRIINMSKKCKFHYDPIFFSSTDGNYKTFINLIQTYFLEYKCFVVKTTIEGELITKENMDEFWDFAQCCLFQERYMQELNNFYNAFSENNRLNFTRLMFEGKSDYLQKHTQLNLHDDIKLLIERNMQSKTSGWVSKWIEYFCLKNMNIPWNDRNRIELFRKEISLKKDEMQKKFKLKFPMLYDIFIMMEEELK